MTAKRFGILLAGIIGLLGLNAASVTESGFWLAPLSAQGVSIQLGTQRVSDAPSKPEPAGPPHSGDGSVPPAAPADPAAPPAPSAPAASAPNAPNASAPNEGLASAAPNDEATKAAYQQMSGPRPLLEYFIDRVDAEDYPAAVLTMDFSLIPNLAYDKKMDYALKLCAVIYRLRNFDPQNVPEESTQATYNLKPDPNYDAIPLMRQADGTWRFAPGGVVQIPKLFEATVEEPLRYKMGAIGEFVANLPHFFHEVHCGLKVLQWTILSFFLFFGWIFYKIFPWVTSHLVFLIIHLRKTDKKYIPSLTKALRPLGYVGMIWIWFFGIRYIRVFPSVIWIIFKILFPICLILVTVTVLRLVNLFEKWFLERIDNPTNKILTVMVALIAKIVKFLILCFAFILIIQIFGFSAVGVLSGMGIGGIAVALAAQQTISNFFGSLTILMDRPFVIGDYIIVKGIEGFVESLGLRSTCIRTLYDSCVFVPNSELATSTIDNMGQRTARRFKTTLGLQYDTPISLLRAFRSGVRTIIENHPQTRKDDIRVSVFDLGASSIDISLVCFLVVPNAQIELRVREELILQILELAEKLGVSFAFPSQTNYVIETKNLDYPMSKDLNTPKNSADLGQKTAEQVLWPEKS